MTWSRESAVKGWSDCVSTLLMPLNTRYASSNSPSTDDSVSGADADLVRLAERGFPGPVEPTEYLGDAGRNLGE